MASQKNYMSVLNSPAAVDVYIKDLMSHTGEAEADYGLA